MRLKSGHETLEPCIGNNNQKPTAVYHSVKTTVEKYAAKVLRCQ